MASDDLPKVNGMCVGGDAYKYQCNLFLNECSGPFLFSKRAAVGRGCVSDSGV